MKWREIAQSMGLDVPHWRAHALDYLETNGFVFLIDFGTDNAVDKARAHWRARKVLKP